MSALVGQLAAAEERAAQARNYALARELSQAKDILTRKLQEINEFQKQEAEMVQAKDYRGAGSAAAGANAAREELVAEETRVTKEFASVLAPPAIPMGHAVPAIVPVAYPASVPVATITPVAAPTVPASFQMAIVPIHAMENRAPPAGAEPGGQWISEKYFGPAIFWLGLCCCGPIFTALVYHLATLDTRCVYVEPEGSRFPEKLSMIKRFVACEILLFCITIVWIVIVVIVDANAECYCDGCCD